MRIIHIIFPLLIIMLNIGCEPFANSFPNKSDAKMYKADEYVSPTSNPEQLKVVTWNIRLVLGVYLGLVTHAEKKP